MLLTNQIAGFLKLKYLRKELMYEVDILHVGRYP